MRGESFAATSAWAPNSPAFTKPLAVLWGARVDIKSKVVPSMTWWEVALGEVTLKVMDTWGLLEAKEMKRESREGALIGTVIHVGREGDDSDDTGACFLSNYDARIGCPSRIAEPETFWSM